MRWAGTALTVAALAACGGRTGLFVLSEDGDGAAAAGVVDSGVDELPPVQVTPPPPIPPGPCADAGATLIYVIAQSGNLFSFDPETALFRRIGPITCQPVGAPAQPFSMAVDRTGIAYVLYSTYNNSGPGDGQLFRVTIASGACQSTTFVVGQHGFASSFGMGFAQDTADPGETLFVASDQQRTTDPAPALASIDTGTFALQEVGPLKDVNEAELTGTGAGDLFAFFGTSCSWDSNQIYTCTGSAIGQLDKTTGRLLSESLLDGVVQGAGWAFAFWGGDFYTFTAPQNDPTVPPGDKTVVKRFRPTDGSIAVVAGTPELIVGAGVSTCAPVSR
jgi:hypothetical protein